MNLSEYQPLAFSTAKKMANLPADLLHVALGLQTEGGEFATNVKRIVVYGKVRDDAMTANMIEELGDFAWYLALAATVLGQDLGTISIEHVLEEASDSDLLDMEEASDSDLLDMERACLMMSEAVLGTWLNCLSSPEGTDNATMRDRMQDALAIGVGSLTLACKSIDIEVSEVLTKNIDKLKLRFPDKYSDEAAEARADKGGLTALES